ncbi:hypothetical protein PC9H_001773 [Pleurotus ostreatus]|uniref:Uncharacterized protein n=1 Tax=Pleurotus ostreatus TaxID=5322 RepID=A0A8H6ZHE8_PLEOS|nr:uncharacterized protein PC9H_001773 [Pleurotus ostreatus]KAF7419188.1 hypothetical protein PC9H_001773 [Pleurotus ostreatus]
MEEYTSMPLPIRIPTSTPELPLLRTRLVLLVLTEVFFIVAGSLCLKIFTKHGDVQDLINESVIPGVTVKLEYNDVKTATIVLFIATHIATAILAKIIILHLQDIYNFIPLFIAKKLRIANKRLASTTLGYQALGLSVIIVFNAVSLGFFSFFVFKREQTVRVVVGDDVNVRIPDGYGMQVLDRLGIALAYHDTYYCTPLVFVNSFSYPLNRDVLIVLIIVFIVEITAKLPWVALLFAVPTTFVTIVARIKRQASLTDITQSSSSGPEKGDPLNSGVDEGKAEGNVKAEVEVECREVGAEKV